MLDESSNLAQMWTAVQEPRAPDYAPNSYLLLLSALDTGWQIRGVELANSWDQHGFIYLVTLRKGEPGYLQQLILPKNALIEELLADMQVI